MSNPTCTGRDVLCRNRRGVGLYSVKRIEDDQKGMKTMWIIQGNELHRCLIRQFFQ